MALERIEKIFSIFGNFSVIIGIGFAVYQINMAIDSEKRGIAINAISEVKSNGFLKAQTRLAAGPEGEAYINDKSLFLFDLNYVLNTYDALAMYYINHIADRCIIKQGVYQTAFDFEKILDRTNCDNRRRASFDQLLEMMKEEKTCNNVIMK